MKYTYRFLPPAVVLFSLFNLTACGINTKFDDADYRPVGASTPLNSETHTLQAGRSKAKEVNKAQVKKENSNTRYIKPGETAISIPQTKTTTSIQQKPDLSSSTTLHNAAAQNHNNTLTHSIKQIFHHRYGSTDTILKISRTVQIHCDIKLIKNQQQPNTNFKLCRYQFPDICGAHQFSVIFNNDKQLLMYMDRQYQRNIIDTLSGSEDSSPGLWDKDDYVSSKLLTVEQLLSKSSNTTTELGWIVDTSNNEKAQLGRSYHAAIKEASKCF